MNHTSRKWVIVWASSRTVSIKPFISCAWEILSCFSVYFRFTYLFLAPLALHSCAGFVVAAGGHYLVVMCRLLIAVAPLIADHRLQGTRVSVVVAYELSSCGSWTLERRLNSYGPWAQLLCGMRNLPRSRIEPVSSVSAGRFFTSELPGKPSKFWGLENWLFYVM